MYSNFTREAQEQYKLHMINQLWKLIPMKENEENWQAHLETTIEEVSGLVKLYNNKGIGLSLLSKLMGMRELDNLDFPLYRKTVFECIDLLGKVIGNE